MAIELLRNIYNGRNSGFLILIKMNQESSIIRRVGPRTGLIQGVAKAPCVQHPGVTSFRRGKYHDVKNAKTVRYVHHVAFTFVIMCQNIILFCQYSTIYFISNHLKATLWNLELSEAVNCPVRTLNNVYSYAFFVLGIH